jgi:cobaltochelatase CobT
MRGDKIVNVASWITILCELLEKIGVATQVLGYTTRARKGEQSRDVWLKNGKPAKPGQLNDIRHIIYKEFSSLLKDVRLNFGLMTREWFTKRKYRWRSINFGTPKEY